MNFLSNHREIAHDIDASQLKMRQHHRLQILLQTSFCCHCTNRRELPFFSKSVSSFVQQFHLTYQQNTRVSKSVYFVFVQFLVDIRGKHVGIVKYAVVMRQIGFLPRTSLVPSIRGPTGPMNLT